MSPKFLVSVSSDHLVKNDESCRDLVDEAKNYLLLPNERAQMEGPRTRPRKPVKRGEVLFAGTSNSQISDHSYAPAAKKSLVPESESPNYVQAEGHNAAEGHNYGQAQNRVQGHSAIEGHNYAQNQSVVQGQNSFVQRNVVHDRGFTQGRQSFSSIVVVQPYDIDDDEKSVEELN